MKRKIANYAKMEEIPISNIHPRGWLWEYLRLQAEGLTGHLEAAGYPFDQVGWNKFDVDTTEKNDNPGWWAYEQVGYWVDGMERLAELMNHRKLKQKAAESIEFVLAHKDADGYLGPKLLKSSTGWNRWPHAVFFRAMMAKYAATEDRRILDAVVEHYLGNEQDYSNARDVMNVEAMLWAYLQSGEEKLLELAEENYRAYNEKCRDDNCVDAHLSNRRPYAHGVTYNEFAKLGAILYICTGKKEYLRPTIKAYRKIDRFHMLVDGLHCSNEFLLDNDYMQSHETCDISDYTWALGYLLMATGDGEWADRIERCIFNAGIGSVDEKFRALQYFSCPNQLVLDRHSNHNAFFKGDKWMSYRPNPGTECCAGNVNRFFPNYCARMWMKKRRDIFAVLYGASEVSYGKRDAKITIRESTDYPFEDKIRFTFSMQGAHKLRFHLRIPGWCTEPSVTVCGTPYPVLVKNGFTMIERTFYDGDTVELDLPAEIRVRDDHGKGNYVERGPLVFALGLYGDRRIDQEETRQTPEFPAYNIYPDGEWNYGLCTSPEDLAQIRLERRTEVDPVPFDIYNTPISIKIPARKLIGWTLKKRNRVRAVHNLYERPWKTELKKGKFLFTPRIPDKKKLKEMPLSEKKMITLVPMAAAKVRLTVFPKID